MMFRKSAVVCIMLAIGCGLYAGSNDIDHGVALIDKGELAAAEKVFSQISASSASSNLEKGSARKNLGTIRFRQGRGGDAIREYDQAEKLLLAELKKNKNAGTGEEYGKLCYQRANCRLSLLENELANARFNFGTTAFGLMKKYVFPMRKDIRQAKEFYPEQGKADLGLLDAEADIAEARIWISTSQTKSAERLYGQALKKLDASLALEDIKSDAKKKMLLRKAAVIMESRADGKKSYSEIVPVLRDAIAFKSGNVELDNAAVTLFATYALRYSADPEKDFPDMKSSLLAAVETLESLREKNLASADFNAKKNYFASRTGTYETLLEYHARNKDIQAMIAVIDAMKNRSIRDYLRRETGDSDLLKRLQNKLDRQNSSAIIYFIGREKVWIIHVDPDEAVFRSVPGSGDICSKIDFVINSCSGPAGFGNVPRKHKIRLLDELNWLYLNLFKPEYERHKTKKRNVICISPHNRLNYFPFCALADRVSAETSWSDKLEGSHFLAEDGLPVALVPSLNIYVSGSDSKPEKGETVLFGRSDFSKPANSMRLDLTGEMFVFKNLPGVETELKDIAGKLKLPGSCIYINNDASEEKFCRLFSERKIGVVHIATHGALHPYHPLDSFLLLAAANGYDGELTVKELLEKYRNKFSCSLIVISACNTNRGEKNLLPGDDIAALSLAFMIAGAKNVISTQWPASDETFPSIMCSFYSQPDYQDNPAGDMSRALRHFLRNNPQRRDPFFWANITIQSRN